MNGRDQNRSFPMRLVASPANQRPDATAPASDSDSDDDDDDDYIDAGSSFQQQMQRAYVRQPAMGYVTSSVQRSSMVPEAVYSQLDVVGCGPPSRRRRSTCWSCLCVTASFVSVLLNLVMSIAALIVIIRVTSPDSDVIGTLLWSLQGHDRSNCVASTDNASHPNAVQSLHGQLKMNDSFQRTPLDKSMPTETSKSGMQCAAHMFFVYGHDSPSCKGNDNSYTKLTNYSDGGNHAFRRRCIVDGGGEMKVLRGGLYVFYDHLAVCRCAGDSGFRQRLYRRPAKADNALQKVLVEERSAGGTQAGGEGCVGEPAFSSDLFTLVRLEDGDSVWIEGKPASAVYRPNEASFFGLYRL